MRLQTRWLDLVACGGEVAQAILRNKADTETLFGMGVPEEWLAQDLQDLLPLPMCSSLKLIGCYWDGSSD